MPISLSDKLFSYRGPKDAGQLSWTNGGYPEVCSCDSMTDLLKAKKIGTTEPWQYRSKGWEIGITQE